MSDLNTHNRDSRGRARSNRGKSKSNRRGRAPGRGSKLGEYSPSELLSLVFELFRKKKTVTQISKYVAENFEGVTLAPHDYYRMFREGCEREEIVYNAPFKLGLARQIQERFPWLKDVQVINTAVLRDVANRGADFLIRLLKAYRSTYGKEVVHMGFTGGHAMRELAVAFAKRLCQPTRGLPETVVFHALATGFDPTQPQTNPNGFFNMFADNPMLQVEAKFYGLSAPAMVTPTLLQELKKQDELKQAYAAARTLDIVATSGSEWADEDCGLRSRMQASPESVRILEENGCVGDILWLPLSRSGPITVETELRALSLIELSELPAIIKGRTRVMLMLGPCGGCGMPKGNLLECVLRQRRPLVTDLILDSRTAVQGTPMLRDGH